MRIRSSLLLTILAVVPLMVASACSTTDCSTAAPVPAEAEFIGTAITVTGDEVNFKVDEVLVGQLGSTVAVRYFDDTGKYLHSGRQYRIAAWSSESADGSLTSAVKTANNSADRTVNADGSEIDTGELRGLSGWLPTMVFLVPVAAIATVVLHRLGILVRSRRRVRRKPVSRSR